MDLPTVEWGPTLSAVRISLELYLENAIEDELSLKRVFSAYHFHKISRQVTGEPVFENRF